MSEYFETTNRKGAVNADLIDRQELICRLKAWDNKANGIPNYAWKVINEMEKINE